MDNVTIYDAHGMAMATVKVGAGSTRRFLVMQEDSVTLRFSLAEPLHFGIGCYADMADEGGRFYAKDAQTPAYNAATGGYDYELRLDADYWLWGNKLFKYTPGSGGREASWSLTASPEVHLGILLRNLKAHGYTYNGKDYGIAVGGTVSTAAKAVTYDNASMIDALNAMAEAWGCEWWVKDGLIHLGRMESDTQPVDFRVGVNVESMERSESKSDYATRVYVFGGERNVPSRYRKKLVFTATSVGLSESGAASVKDAYREIFPSMFAEGDVDEDEYTTGGPNTYESEIDVPDNRLYQVHYRLGYLAGGDKYFRYRPIPAGDYTVAFEGGVRMTWETKALPLGVDSFRVAWKVTIGDMTLWEESSEVGLDALSTAMPSPPALSLHLDEDLPSDTTVWVSGQVEAGAGTISDYTLTGKVAFSGIRVTLRGERDSARVAVSFLSGSLAGKSYEGTLNAGQDADGEGWITLPSGAAPSAGDTYAIGNIVEAEVPAGYFTPDSDEELTMGGVTQRRLMLPLDWNGGRNCIDAAEGLADAEVVELAVVNESIYPRFSTEAEDGSALDGRPATGVATRQSIEWDEDKGQRESLTYWAIQDGTFAFDEKYRIEGEDLEVTFTSGLLNGMTFKADFVEDGTALYGKGGQWFEIVRSDDYGRDLPDAILYPQAGDRYILSGWDSDYIAGAGLVEQAEEELLEWGKEYVKKLFVDPSTYNCHMMSDCAYGKDGDGRLDPLLSYKDTILPGDPVRLFSDAFFKEGSRDIFRPLHQHGSLRDQTVASLAQRIRDAAGQSAPACQTSFQSLMRTSTLATPLYMSMPGL